MSRLIRLYITSSFAVRARDPNCPLRGYEARLLTELLDALPRDCLVPNLYLTIVASRRGVPLLEVDVSHRVRRGREAGGTTWRGARISPIPARLVRFSLAALWESRRFRSAMDTPSWGRCFLDWPHRARAITNIRSRKSGAHSRSASRAAWAPLTSNRQPPRSSPQSAQVVADRECLRRRADVEDLESAAVEELGDRSAREVLDVGRNHRPPASAHDPGQGAARVGQRQPHDTVGVQQPADMSERLCRDRQVLDHVAHDHCVKGSRPSGAESSSPVLTSSPSRSRA